MARENLDVVVVILRNDNYAILELEMARVREGELTDKMRSMMSLDVAHDRLGANRTRPWRPVWQCIDRGRV